MTGSAAGRLHPALLYHLLNTLEWRELRPLQQAAIGPIMDGLDVLLLAPTAGGKTEAAAFPLFTRMSQERWAAPSVLYLCPLRALLNNLEPRLSAYASWLGRRCAVWYGDTPDSRRRNLLVDRPDVLLTTPESMEAMLISSRTPASDLFGALRSVVVDEVHAFAGDDRGWHLLAVLERLARLAGRPLQRVGLSATVGNPADLLRWLQGAPGGGRSGVVVGPEPSTGDQPDLALDFVGSIDNAATVIAALHGGEKRLVFCDSRRRVEELATALQQRGVETFVSHSSLSADQRRRSERAFAEARDCVIVATSTLELGIDVGDLDRVIQVNAPPTVAAVTQRLGRTGRRPGGSRNCLFLATDRAGLLHAAALLWLRSRNWIESIVAPPSPLHIVAQQILALTLQEVRIGRHDLRAWLPVLPIDDGAVDTIVDHLLDGGFLDTDDGMLFIGQQGERTFGRRHFMDLTSVFTSDPRFIVLHGRTEIGSVHAMALAARGEGPARLLLGGMSWSVAHIDWSRRVCHVNPSKEPGTLHWPGSPQVLSAEVTGAMREVVQGAAPGATLSRRAMTELARAREDLRDFARRGGSVVSRGSDGRMRWWTWAGGSANISLAAALPGVADGHSRVENLWLRLRPSVTVDELRQALRLARSHPLPAPAVAEQAVDGLKFAAALPRTMAVATLARRLGDPEEATRMLRLPDPVLVTG